jgi:hypothetical protein
VPEKRDCSSAKEHAKVFNNKMVPSVLIKQQYPNVNDGRLWI